MNADQRDLHQVVAGEVRAHLGRAGLSGYQAAEQLGWTQPYISRRLSGRVAFNLGDLDKVARLLDVPVTVFFQAPDIGALRPGGATSQYFAPAQVRALRVAA